MCEAATRAALAARASRTPAEPRVAAAVETEVTQWAHSPACGHWAMAWRPLCEDPGKSIHGGLVCCAVREGPPARTPNTTCWAPCGAAAASSRPSGPDRTASEREQTKNAAAGQKLSEFGIRAVTRQHRSTEHTVPNRRTDRPAFLGPSDRQLGALAVGCWALLICFWLLRFSRSPPMPGERCAHNRTHQAAESDDA